MRLYSIKRRQQILLVCGLHWQYGAPTVNCSLNILYRYSRFAERYIAKLCKSLQQKDGGSGSHSPS